MELKFSLSKSDFVTYQLFTVSQSEAAKKKRKNNWLLPPLYSALVGIILLLYKGPVFLLVFFIFAAIWLTIYPFYSKWYYKVYYSKYIEKHYKNRIDLIGKVALKDREIYLSDETGETNQDLKEIKEIIEINTHAFVIFNSGMTIILPKDKIDLNSMNSFIRKLEQLTDITRKDKSEWEWR